MRAYGITNAAPYANAPAVGASGDTYWNTTDQSLYVSNGTAWVKAGPGAGGPPSGTAGGDLTGSYPNPTIAANAVGNAEISDVAWAKVTGAPTSLPPSGAAGGSLAGTYPNPSIAALAVSAANLAVRTAPYGYAFGGSFNAQWNWPMDGNWYAAASCQPTLLDTNARLVLVLGVIIAHVQCTSQPASAFGFNVATRLYKGGTWGQPDGTTLADTFSAFGTGFALNTINGLYWHFTHILPFLDTPSGGGSPIYKVAVQAGAVPNFAMALISYHIHAICFP